MRLALIGLWVIIAILSGSWARVFLTITREGSITLIEPNHTIAYAELALALFITGLALIVIGYFLISKKERGGTRWNLKR